MEAGEGGVDKYWKRLAANLGRMVQPWPTLRQLRYKLLTDLKLGWQEEKSSKLGQKVYTFNSMHKSNWVMNKLLRNRYCKAHHAHFQSAPQEGQSFVGRMWIPILTQDPTK